MGMAEEEFSETFLDTLTHQIEWAMHMGIPAVILPICPREKLPEYARVILSLGSEAQARNLQFWIRTKLDAASMDTFETVHRLCDGLSNVGMLLDLDPVSYENQTDFVGRGMMLTHKAIGMQLKAVTFRTKVFLTNKGGFPALAKCHQAIFMEILKRIGRTIRVLVEGNSRHENIPTPGATKCLAYLQYIRHVRSRPAIAAALDTDEAKLETPYLDGLQRPLEPLKDQLEFSMYETFEKDPVKYAKYQKAVSQAVTFLQQGDKSQKYVIAVAGAGRGPLVTRSIQGFRDIVKSYDITLKVYALEKNPSALVYLKTMAQTHPLWQGVVTVINTDVRKLTRVQLDGNQIDVVVSELLGSFGDNELSPECLDPLLASKCCKKSTLSIPTRYSSFVAPISSCRLHTEATQQAQVPHEGALPLGTQRAMETSYVVRTHAASQTHAEQLCWTFEHPSKNKNMERTAKLEFMPDWTHAVARGCGYGPVDRAVSEIMYKAPALSTSGVTLHGLVGSFTAVLFEKGSNRTIVSTAPHEFSTGMFSWFPIYFPFREPLRVPAGSSITVNMWRKTRDNKVWFEWSAVVHRNGEIIATTPVHNPNGRSSYVSM